jgi:hypothetical protein
MSKFQITALLIAAATLFGKWLGPQSVELLGKWL